MIIKNLHIDGFGIFSDYNIDNLGNGIHIIKGNNEAGKSTLLKFIRYTLFGYPRLIEKRMAPLKGGKHSGRIGAELSSGEYAIFERDFTDKISLTYSGNLINDESQWFNLLGNASQELFENVYAFTIDELSGISSLSKSGMEDKIFSVGLGLGNITLGEVESKIEDITNSIYKKQGRVQIIPNILKEIGEQNNKIKEIKALLPKYNQLVEEGKLQEQQLITIKENHKTAENEKSFIDMHLKCYDSFVHYINAKKELEKLPEFKELPVDGANKLEKIEAEESRLQHEFSNLQDNDIEGTGIKQLKEKLHNISYNDELLKSKDAVNYIKDQKSLYNKTRIDQTEDSLQLSELDKEIRQSIKNINSNLTIDEIRDYEIGSIHSSVLNDYKKELEEVSAKKSELQIRYNTLLSRKRNIDSKSILYALSIILMIGVPVTFYYSYTVWSIGFLMASIVALVFAIKTKVISELDEIKNEINLLDDKELNIKSNCSNYIEKELLLYKNISPDAALELLKDIKTIQEKIKQRDNIFIRIEKQSSTIIEVFEEQINKLWTIISDEKIPDNKEMAANKIISEFEEAVAKQQNEKVLVSDLDKLEKSLAAVNLQIESLHAEKKALFNNVGVENSEDFYKIYTENEKVRELNERIENYKNTIETIAGINKTDEVINYLSSNDKHELELRASELDDAISETADIISQKNKNIGEINKEISIISGESELSEEMTKLENLKENLRFERNNYISGKLALNVLSQVKEVYEQKMQPAVIKTAGEYFKTISNGRYERINISLSDKDLRIYDNKQSSKTIDELSRGTKEQLLISLRLGFIEEYEKSNEALPLIVDEVFVNFDADRAKEMAQILEEFAKTRQVLVFTCHQYTEQLFGNPVIKKL